jgi:Zn-finger nucleic acid-binding protein/ribosomal protein L40E
MRLLVVCSKCQRQFDASSRSVGSCFRCHCGAVVKVKLPRHHDALVVRCSSCGAPREEGAAACRFCGSDFTLHEQDLHTVCPKCLARVSDQAKFCHHCGTRLAPEALAADATSLVCPACGESNYLGDRRIGECSALECCRCAGLWLGNETFQRLSERAESEAVDLDRLFDSPHAQPGRRGETDQNEPEGWRYRKCPACGKIMHRRNYAGSSGVIIDFCREHGVWFDAEELPRILAWIRSGGLAKAKQDQAHKAAQEARLKQSAPSPYPRSPVIGVPLGDTDESWRGDFFDDLFDGIASLFRRTR